MTIQSRVGRVLIIAAGFALMLLVISIARETVGQTPPPVGPGDWVIPRGDSTIITADTVTLEGNLIVKPTAELILNTVVLEFDCSSDGEFGFYNYGILSVSGTSTITSATANSWTFQVYSGSDSVIIDTTISLLGYEALGNTSRYGLRVDSGATAFFAALTYSDGFWGINIYADDVTVDSSTFTNIPEIVISLNDVDGGNITGNTITGGSIGVNVAKGRDITISGNDISDQTDPVLAGKGIYVISWAPGTLTEDILIHNNTIDGTGSANGLRGIWILDIDGWITVENNTISNWPEGGIDHDATGSADGSLFQFNTISFCGPYGLKLGVENAITRSNTIFNNTNNIRFVDGARSYNDTLFNSTYYDVYIGNADIDVTTTNTTFQKAMDQTHADSSLEVNWYLDVQVIDQAGQPVDGASLTVDDEAGTRIYTETTNSQGWVRWMIIPDYLETKTTTTFYNPYTITGTKDSREGQVTVNISGASRTVILQISSYAQRRSVHVNLFNAYTGLGLIEELLILEFSLDGVNWTRSDSNDLDLEYVWGGTIQLHLKDFYNVTVSTVSLDMDSPTAPATDPEGVTRQGVSEIFWDASIPILTINVDPPYDLNDWILELDGVEVGFFKEGTKIQIQVLGGLKGDLTHLYTLRWPKQPIIIDNKTVNVSAGDYNITAEGDETRKIGHISVIPPMKLAPDYAAAKPAKSSEYSFRDFLQEYWLTVSSMIIAVIVGFIGYLRYKQAKRTNELLGDDAGGGD